MKIIMILQEKAGRLLHRLFGYTALNPTASRQFYKFHAQTLQCFTLIKPDWNVKPVNEARVRTLNGKRDYRNRRQQTPAFHISKICALKKSS